MRILSKSLIPIVSLEPNEMRLVLPQFHEWYMRNKRVIGMHQLKFRRKLIELFSNNDIWIDTDYTKLKRTQ